MCTCACALGATSPQDQNNIVLVADDDPVPIDEVPKYIQEHEELDQGVLTDEKLDQSVPLNEVLKYTQEHIRG